jgi:putative methionine-R-sulfoxide reductase with GAF domain
MFNATDLVNDLQEMRDEGFLSDALLRRAVRGIADSDDRFHWTAVFLMRDGGEELWLHNYVGDPARYAEIPVGTGVCGAAASAGTNMTVPDVTAVEEYTPCGPDVSSEMVVLIRAGSDIFGGVDLGSEDGSAFTEDDEAAVQAVSDKLAEQIAAERR